MTPSKKTSSRSFMNNLHHSTLQSDQRICGRCSIDRGQDSRQFMKDFGDCGWVFQNLKPAVVCTKVAPKKWVWTVS